MKKVYVLLAEGFETVEALTPVDICKRSKIIDVETVSITENEYVTSSHGVTVKANQTWNISHLEDGDLLVLPGGFPGYTNLAGSKEVGQIVKYYLEHDKYVAAICGAPVVLAANGLAKGCRITCHHSLVDKMQDYHYTGEKVTIDGRLITGIGAGRSFDFALAFLEVLSDKGTIERLKKGLELIKQ